MSGSPTAQAISSFGSAVAARFATGGGEPEDLLRNPFDDLVRELGGQSGVSRVVLAGEHHLADDRVRPDFAVYVGDALVGFAELKAPGKGADPSRFKGHDREQWQRLACLPNVLYSDRQSFALYRYGERIGAVARLVGDVETAGADLAPGDGGLRTLIEDFLRWQPVAPRRPKELALTTSRLCRLLRAEVGELIVGDTGLQALAEDWRRLLFPEATDDEFADGYAQTITFSLLLARVEGIELAGRDLGAVAADLGQRHTLVGRALDVLTDPGVQRRLAVSISTLQRLLAVADCPTVSRGDPAAWLYFYEEFLDGYDPSLRRSTGSYYTPVEVVDPMVRLVDDLVRRRLGHDRGLAAPEVTIVDPAAGTGTFLFRVIDRIPATIEDQEGIGAVGPRLRQAAARLIGFELQTGPYSVAELRLANEFSRRDAALATGDLRLYLTDTLSNPFETEQHMPAIYAAIARSRRLANRVKREEPVLVVIGNPPYRERSHGRGGWVEQGAPGAVQGEAPFRSFLPPRDWGLGAHVKHLYNPYVYFWRWASWKVFEHHPADKGVVAFITVAGFLNGPGFAAMRAHLRRTADAVWVIDCSPEGHQPEVATRVFQGVQQPVCITIALRGGTTGDDVPAPVRFASVHGRRNEKFKTLADLTVDADSWVECPSGWRDPFLPAGTDTWTAMPALEDLLAWSGSGTMPGRTWVVSPSPATLRARWLAMVAAEPDRKRVLLAEHKRDRTIDTRLSDNLPGYPPPPTALADETSGCEAPERYGYRSFDRQWIIPDKRVINQPNPGLWQVRTAPGQLYLTALMAHSPRNGPPTTFSALVPDLHHYRGSFGGRAWPLWLDAAGTQPNVVPGLLDHLSSVHGRSVAGPEIFAYLAAVAGHPAYTARFAADLGVPGLRIPLTADRSLFDEAVELGERVLWLHTYGRRHADDGAGRPSGAPRLPTNIRPRVMVTISDAESAMPETIAYDQERRTLHVGEGEIAPVGPEVWDYEVSGMGVVKRWFDRRKRDPDGRRSSPLDTLFPASWDPEWTSELLELLNVVALLIELEPLQADLLERILDAPLIRVADLTEARVLPATGRPGIDKPPRPGRLFDT